MTPRAGLGGRQNSEAHTRTPLPRAAGQGWAGQAAGGGARHVWPSGGTGGARPGEKRSWGSEDVVSATVATGLAVDTVLPWPAGSSQAVEVQGGGYHTLSAVAPPPRGPPQPPGPSGSLLVTTRSGSPDPCSFRALPQHGVARTSPNPQPTAGPGCRLPALHAQPQDCAQRRGQVRGGDYSETPRPCR